MPSVRLTLVVDTNVISHALIQNQQEAYKELFRNLEQTYKFIVSGFTRFELMRSSDKEHRESIAKYIRQNMTSIDLSRVLMDFTARVSYLYSKHPTTKGLSIGDGDVVNAALAIIKASPVLTQDNLDYPAPFFKEIYRKPIQYKSTRGRNVVEMVYLMEPDMEHLRHCFGEHEV